MTASFENPKEQVGLLFRSALLNVSDLLSDSNHGIAETIQFSLHAVDTI